MKSPLKFLGRSTETGASIVEFAIVGSVFFLVLLGIFDFGRVVLYYNTLSNAAREGARYGIIAGRSEDSICAQAASKTWLPNVTYPVSACGSVDDLTVDATAGDPGGTQPVRVSLSYVFRPVTPMFEQIIQTALGGPLIIRTHSSMYVEDA